MYTRFVFAVTPASSYGTGDARFIVATTGNDVGGQALAFDTLGHVLWNTTTGDFNGGSVIGLILSAPQPQSNEQPVVLLVGDGGIAAVSGTMGDQLWLCPGCDGEGMNTWYDLSQTAIVPGISNPISPFDRTLLATTSGLALNLYDIQTGQSVWGDFTTQFPQTVSCDINRTLYVSWGNGGDPNAHLDALSLNGLSPNATDPTLLWSTPIVPNVFGGVNPLVYGANGRVFGSSQGIAVLN